MENVSPRMRYARNHGAANNEVRSNYGGRGIATSSYHDSGRKQNEYHQTRGLRGGVGS